MSVDIFPPPLGISPPPCVSLSRNIGSEIRFSSFEDSETAILGRNVSPPSIEAEKRVRHPKLVELSRLSYHITPTTPELFTASVGLKSSGPFSPPGRGTSSLTT